MKRFIIAVMDSLGVGELPDAADYNSIGANTLGHIAEYEKLSIPNLCALGMANILPLAGQTPAASPKAAWGKMAASSAGMDTTSGHWEISGIILANRLPTYPQGFPDEIIDPFRKAIGRDILGNCPASGTQIIEDLGEEHLATGSPIVYTSADSVFQVAAHEAIIPPDDLYKICRIARGLLQGKHAVGRVIARPFVGNAKDGFRRTENRRDFSLIPPAGCLLEQCRRSGIPVISIGKIYDIFAGCHIDKAYPGHNNAESAQSLLRALAENQDGFIFANFVDFDTLYGHRNDTIGYGKAIERFDAYLPELLSALSDDDILVICADHGNDPSSPSPDHNREYVPLLVYGAKIKPVCLGIRSTFADLGRTAAEYLGAGDFTVGKSFLKEIIRED